MLLLALIAGCTVLLVRAVSPAIDAANEWLVLVDEQRWDDAYDGLCAGTRQTQSPEEVVPILQGDFGDGIDDYQISQFQNTNGRVSVGGDITIGGREGAITLAMSDASGDWQVCGYTFERLDLGS